MYKAAFLPPKGARELGSSRGSSRSTNSSILAAVNNPRLPPGGWEISEKRTDANSVLRHPLRRLVPPSDRGLDPRPRTICWEEKKGGGAGMVHHYMAPKLVPQWRYGRTPPQWWIQQVKIKRMLQELKPPLSIDAAELKQLLKVKLAEHLDRVVDTFRQWDTDNSGTISAHEFYAACRTGLGISGYRREFFDELFNKMDADNSGEIEYKELNAHLRRRVEDPSFRVSMSRAASAKMLEAAKAVQASRPQSASVIAQRDVNNLKGYRHEPDFDRMTQRQRFQKYMT